MERIDYFKVFAFLAFAGSAFLSAIFLYPVFTVSWFVIMILFVAALTVSHSVLTILVFVSFAYIPLGLIYAMSDYVSRSVDTYSVTQTSNFAWLLIAFTIIECILAISWLTHQAQQDS
jgi:hypothetical protein